MRNYIKLQWSRRDKEEISTNVISCRPQHVARHVQVLDDIITGIQYTLYTVND